MIATAENELRVLWISHDPLPSFADAIGARKATSGGWLVALADALVNSGKVSLGVVSDVAGTGRIHRSLGGVENYTVPVPGRRRGLLRPTIAMVREYQRVVREFDPDVIHIQGTECFFGLLSAEGHLDRPTVISIQGIIDFHRRHLLGRMSLLDILRTRTLRDWVRLDGLFEQRAHWNRRAAVERRIFAGNSAFIGRTLWDRAHLRRLNPAARYYQGNEMLRPAFYGGRWKPENIRRHSILAPSASYPLKGFHVLIMAVALLRREFPDITVRVPSARFRTPRGVRGWYAKARRTGYANYLDQLIRSHDLTNHVEPLGPLSAEQMADEFARAHVFVLPSFVENSPNSLAEAMMIGTPSVVSFAGGVPSIIRDGAEALAFPPGDEAMLAEQTRRIFQDDALASGLSKAARQLARKRYSRESIVDLMIQTYQDVANG